MQEGSGCIGACWEGSECRGNVLCRGVQVKVFRAPQGGSGCGGLSGADLGAGMRVRMQGKQSNL